MEDKYIETVDNLNILSDLTAEMENARVEFKETTGQLERAMETICAFLNGEGGTVLFGITDKGKIIGQQVSDKTKRDIAEAINKIEPCATVQTTYIETTDDKKVVSLHVEKTENERPFTYKGRAYMRVESVTTTMPQSKYNDLLIQREEIRHGWETYPNARLKLSDLDEEEIMKTVRLGIEAGRLPETTGNDIPMILEKLNLYEDGVLKNAAAVLFGKGRVSDYPQCLLRLARFLGEDKRVFLDNQRIRGNLFQLLDAAMAFIFKHLSLAGKTESLEREETLEIPYPAIREAVINSLCHRSYRDAGGSVAIAIYDDRVEIENPGAFPSGWDMNRIKLEHGSKPHNPLIADTLYIRKVLESWGRGINLMVEECKKVGLPEPEYQILPNDIKLTFRRMPTGQAAGKATGQVTGKATGQVTGQVQSSETIQPQGSKTIQPQGAKTIQPRDTRIEQPREQVAGQKESSLTEVSDSQSSKKPSGNEVRPSNGKNIEQAQTQKIEQPQGSKTIQPRETKTIQPRETIQPMDHNASRPTETVETLPKRSVLALIECLGQEELSVSEALIRLNLKSRDNLIKTYLVPALKDKFIERIYPDRINHPKQKYRLTEKGLLLFNKLNQS